MCNAWNHSDGCECGFGPPYDRDVSDYFDQHVGAGGGKNLSSAGPHSRVLKSITNDDQLTTQLASTFLWQSYIGHRDPKRIGKSARLKAAKSTVTIYIVRHGEGFPRHDLLIFDPQIPPDKVEQGYVDVNLTELRSGWRNYSDAYSITRGAVPRWLRGLSLTEVPEIAGEAMNAQHHFFIAMHPPKIVWTTSAEQNLPQIPSPALAVSNKMKGKGLATAGVISVDEEGRIGVTTALHALRKGTPVFVTGVRGSVRRADQITDSCFIEMENSKLPPYSACCGPLTGITPGRAEIVWFDGATSGRVTTHIDGWTPELPWAIDGVQSRIITPAVTNAGDSGAALVITKTGQVVGFAYYRTGFNAKSPHSAWIWAESVFTALHLQ